MDQKNQTNQLKESQLLYSYLAPDAKLQKIISEKEKKLQQNRLKQNQILQMFKALPKQSIKQINQQQEDIFFNFHNYYDQISEINEQKSKLIKTKSQSNYNQLQILAQMESLIASTISLIIQTKQILNISDSSITRHEINPQYLCSTQGCKQNPTICLQQKCKCFNLHKKCIIIPFNLFLSQLLTKVNKKQPQKFTIYMDLKKRIVSFMINRICQERNIIQQWEQSFQNQGQPKNCYIFGFSKQCAPLCRKPRITINFQEGLRSHLNCLCKHIKLTNIVQKQKRKREFNKIYQAYAHILDYLEQKMQEIRQLQSRSYHLNYAEIQIVKFFLSCNSSSIFKQKNQQNFTGNTIFYAKNLKILNKSYFHFNDNQESQQQIQERKPKNPNSIMIAARMGLQKNLNLQYYYFGQKKSLEPFTIQHLKQKWNVVCNIIFNLNIQASALTNLQIFSNNFIKKIDQKDHLKSIENQLQGIFDELNDFQSLKGKKFKIITFDLQSLKEFIKKNQKIFKKINLSNFKGINYCLNYGIIQQRKDMRQIILNHLAKLKKINQIHYNKYSNHQILQQLCQNASFINLSRVQAQFKSDFLSFSQIIELCQSHSSKSVNCKLKNVHIGETSNKKFVKIFPKLGYSLNQLSFGMKIFDGLQYSDKNLIKQVQKIYSLRNLALIGSFHESNVIRQMITKLIQQNKHLKCIVFDSKIDSDLVNTDILKSINKNLPKIQKIVIRNCNQVLGISFLQQLTELKVLDLSNCNNILQVQFNRTIIKLQKLTHLVLEGNKWLSKQTFESISTLGQKIQMLNIQNCNIQPQFLLQIRNLQKLQTFVCGLNNIAGGNLIYFTKQCKNIKKLCIQGLNGKYWNNIITNQQLLQIDRNCIKGLRYLNVFDCREIDVSCLIKLRHLRVVVKQKLSKQEVTRLQQKGIIVSL